MLDFTVQKLICKLIFNVWFPLLTSIMTSHFNIESHFNIVYLIYHFIFWLKCQFPQIRKRYTSMKYTSRKIEVSLGIRHKTIRVSNLGLLCANVYGSLSQVHRVCRFQLKWRHHDVFTNIIKQIVGKCQRFVYSV